MRARPDDVVVPPKNLADCFLVQDAYQWLLREIREYETRDDEPYAPKHCRQGVFQGFPALRSDPHNPAPAPAPSCVERHTGRGLTFQCKKLRLEASAQADSR